MGNTFGDGYFSSFRTVPGPTLYAANRNPVTDDVLEIGLIVAFAMTWFCVLLASIGVLLVNWKKCLQTIGIATFILYFITCILVAIWGFGWRVGSIHTETTYKQFTDRVISADVGLKIGLYSFNVTLKGNPVNQSGDMVDYNEHYNFGILQGRLGFGTQAGLVSREFRLAQIRGTPLPILWIAEYFTLDGELIRWGRNHRQAGYYTALLLWTAFCFFLLTVLAIPGSVAYGANMLILTGLTMICSCCVYAGLYQELGPELAIPFESATLKTSYGWAFILTLINGLVLVGSGLLLWLLYLRYPEYLETLLGIDLVDDEESILLEEQPTTAATVVENPASFDNISPIKSSGTRRAPAVGHGQQKSLYESVDISDVELQSSLHFQNRPVFTPEHGISIRRLRKTKRKKPRQGSETATSPVTPNPVRGFDSLEMSSLPGSTVPTNIHRTSSPTSPLAHDLGNPVSVSIKGGVARKAFSTSQTTSQAASFELRRIETLDEVEEDEVSFKKPTPISEIHASAADEDLDGQEV